jgi:hypothetical protein
MIKFFRSIRQKLITEGKIANYLKYAIGEILLVVIGILIALQVNEWNENRKAGIIEKSFLQNVLLDLQKDEKNLNYYQDFFTKRIECLDTLLTYVRNPTKSMGISKFGMYAEPLFYSPSPTQYATTFESAKSMGTFSSFKNKEILKELSQYYADFTLLENTIISITRIIENVFEPIMYNLPESYITKETGNLVVNEENPKAFYEKIESIKDFRNLTPDYQQILNTPKMENYLIGDMGRTFNVVGKIISRKEKLKYLQEKIRTYDKKF